MSGPNDEGKADHAEPPVQDNKFRNTYLGCLLGGAAGDALGAPVEFMSDAAIHASFGPSGIKEFFPAFGLLGAITDDTQMTLFTAEGVLRSRFSARAPTTEDLRVYIAAAYMRWLRTQGAKHELQAELCNGWLIGNEELFSSRAPGVTCMSGLRSMRELTDLAKNQSKGCGGVMRVAPIGLYFASLSRRLPGRHERLRHNAFIVGCESAGITHGHPTGQLASGTFAVILMELLSGSNLQEAISIAMATLCVQGQFEETAKAVDTARRLAAAQPNDPVALHTLGGGWVAEEALAIAIYCALSASDFRSGVELSVNHGGDSDSTGSMTGQLLGAIHGHEVIPATWLSELELHDVIGSAAIDLMLTDWEDGEVAFAISDGEPELAPNKLTKAQALRAYAAMINTRNTTVLAPLLAEDFCHESQRNFDVYDSKATFLEFAIDLNDRLLSEGEEVFAEMGRVRNPYSITCSPTIEGAQADSEREHLEGNIVPCVIVAYGDRNCLQVVAMVEVAENLITRIDNCVIPGPESAQRSGEYPE